jgi:hypothetical protein
MIIQLYYTIYFIEILDITYIVMELATYIKYLN